MACRGGNNSQEHVKQGLFFRFNLVFKGFSKDIEIPYNLQLTFVKELLAWISWNLTKLSYIKSIYFVIKKNWKILIGGNLQKKTVCKFLKNPSFGYKFPNVFALLGI